MLEANTWTLGAAVELCGKINDVFEGKNIIRRTPYHVPHNPGEPTYAQQQLSELGLQ
jgi:hypothetical protein